MAKSIAEYYDILLAIKEGRSELSGLTPHNESSQSFLNDNASGSKVALWRLWLWIMATLAWIMDVKMDIHKEEVDYKLSVKAFGVIRWYHQLALNYQHGHELVWNGQYVYADIDSEDATESRIIKRASVVMVAGVLQFKVAKLNQAGKPEALNTSEKVSFLGYLYELAYPGTNMVVISEAADDLRVRLKMYFDPLLFNTDGSLIADPAIYPVKDAINNFVQNIPFNARMNRQRFIDAIQKVKGVKDLELIDLDARYGTLDYAPVGREYIPFAGHMVLQEEDSNISYESYV